MNSQTGRLLVVDDNANNRDLLCRRLSRQGYTAVAAEDGLQALNMLRAESFDLVLLDVMMPQLDGYEVLRQLKADQGLRHIPVIMISALDDMDSVVRCIELGAEDYLSKPFNPVLLQARIGASLEKKQLRDKEQQYLRRLQQELEVGRRAQADFLPAELPHRQGWRITAAFHPAREVAGDFYDVFDLPGNRLGLVIADVCDKGVGAALFMALVRSLIRAFAEQACDGASDALQAVVLTNDYIARHHHQNGVHMYATLFFGVLDPLEGRIDYVNGGHLPPLLIAREGIQLLEPTGPAVGMMAGSRFQHASIQLQAGDWLIAYTDGITEARNRRGELFGEERLLQLFSQKPISMSDLTSRVQRAVYDFMGRNLLDDDITLLALHREL
jgi:serine phosphatase RsbU (regulator of sigma subunit)